MIKPLAVIASIAVAVILFPSKPVSSIRFSSPIPTLAPMDQTIYLPVVIRDSPAAQEFDDSLLIVVPAIGSALILVGSSVRRKLSKAGHLQIGSAFRFHRGLLIIIAIYVSLAAAYSVFTPIWEAPDEISHFMYIRYMAQSGKLPSVGVMRLPWHYEAYHPPLYYALGAIAARSLNLDIGYPNLQVNPTYTWHKNYFLHTDAEQFPYTGVALTVHLLRLLSIAAGAGTVILTYKISLEIFPRDWTLATLAAGLNAFIPQWTFITGVINNDGYATLFTTLSILWAIRVLNTEQPSSRILAWLGVSLGLSLLTKLSAFPMLVFVLVATTLQRRTAARLRQVLAVSAIVMGVAGWYLARNLVLYGDPLGLNMLPTVIPDLYLPQSVFDLQTWRWLIAGLPNIFRSFWATFGQGPTNILIDDVVYKAAAVITGAGALGVGSLVWPRKLERQQRGALLLLLGSVVITFAGMELFNLQFPTAQGRMMFPVISAASVLLAVGLQRITRIALHVRWSKLLLSIPVILAVINIHSLGNCLAPAYTHIYQPSYNLGSSISLISYDLPQTTVKPGDSLSLTLYWQGQRNIDEDYTVFTHLLDSKEHIVAQQDNYPQNGKKPTSDWRQGEVIIDHYDLSVLPGTAAGKYHLEVGMYDWQTGERLPVYHQNGQRMPFDRILLATIEIRE